MLVTNQSKCLLKIKNWKENRVRRLNLNMVSLRWKDMLGKKSIELVKMYIYR